MKFNLKFITVIGIILVAAVIRLLPHWPNFTPIAAIALFGGVYFSDKRLAFLIPFATLFLTDLVIGFHSTMAFTYIGFFITILLGLWLRNSVKPAKLIGVSILSSVLFFLVTNFGVWMMEGIYPQTVPGLIECYVAAIPFFHYSLLGDLLYTSVLFGGYYALSSKITALA